MELELDADHPHFAKLLAAKNTIMTSTLTATTRVNSHDLRRQQTDKLQRILDKLAEEDDPSSVKNIGQSNGCEEARDGEQQDNANDVKHVISLEDLY